MSVLNRIASLPVGFFTVFRLVSTNIPLRSALESKLSDSASQVIGSKVKIPGNRPGRTGVLFKLDFTRLSSIPDAEFIMKAQYILLALSLSLTGVAATHQDNPPAEKVYKNIKTLVGTPASEVMPSMKFMCASLKVDCEFCHKADDFASDEKQEKTAARHMIEMQKDINAKNFNGRVQVTCNTCHNGSPHPNRVPTISGISRNTITRGGGALVPADVLKKYKDAAGTDLKTLKLEGTATGLGPTATPITIFQGNPNKFTMEFGGQKIGFDGSGAWYKAGTGKAQALPADQAAPMQHFGRFFRGDNAFGSFGELRFAGRDKINGKDVVVLRTAAQNSKVFEDLYFDASTGLLTRVVTYSMTILGSIPESADYSDYRKVGGAMVPFLITQSGGKAPAVIKLDKGEANPKLDDNFFALPIGG